MSNRKELLERAEALGLSFPKNVKTEALEKAIAEQEAKTEPIEEQTISGEQAQVGSEMVEQLKEQLRQEYEQKLQKKIEEITSNVEENINKKVEEHATVTMTAGQRKLQRMREAKKLIRVIVTCRDPQKAAWDGEIISVGNDTIGEVKRYVPFNNEEGWHIEKIIYDALKNKKCSVFVNKRNNRGERVQEAKQISAYGITVLPDLTPNELEQLAAAQRARQSIDD